MLSYLIVKSKNKYYLFFGLKNSIKCTYIS